MKYLKLFAGVVFFAMSVFAFSMLSSVPPTSPLGVEVIRNLGIICGQQSFFWFLGGVQGFLQPRQVNKRMLLEIIRGLSYAVYLLLSISYSLSQKAIDTSVVLASMYSIYKVVEVVRGAFNFPAEFSALQGLARSVVTRNPHLANEIDVENPDPDLIHRLYLELDLFSLVHGAPTWVSGQVVSSQQGRAITTALMREEEDFKITAQQLLKGEIAKGKISEALQKMDFEQLLELLWMSENPEHNRKREKFSNTAETENYLCLITKNLMKTPMSIDGTNKVFVDKENLSLIKYHPYERNKVINPAEVKENTELKNKIEKFKQTVVNYIEQEMVKIIEQNEIQNDNFKSPTSTTAHHLKRRVNVTQEGANQPGTSSENYTEVTINHQHQM